MQTVYRLHTSELDERLLNAIKLLFEDRVIEIKVTDTGSVEQNGGSESESEMDETAYLLRSPANRKYLLEAIEYIDRGQPLIEANFDGQGNIIQKSPQAQQR